MSSLQTTDARTFTIGNEVFSPEKVLIIAELGTGHGGSLAKARELVDAASEAGADCVKFQLVYADEILHPNTGIVPLPGGPIRLFDRFKELELPLDFFAQLKEYVESKELLFLCTPFGLRSARELRSLGARAIKIASPELNHLALIDEVASFGLPTLLSSGVSRLADIERAIERLPVERACLLHCVTSYPAPETDYNLRVLGSLRSVFGTAVGVSDHSMDPELVPSLAVAVGACALEKHLCLSRDDDGLDDPIALPPEDFARMVRSVREVSRIGAEAALEALKLDRGADTVEAVLGDGIKRLAPSERWNYERTNRSIHALRAIAAGETIRAEDIACLRTEKVLRPGLSPEWESSVIGRRALRDIPSGEGIRFEDI
jgi:sialic acid synthase SpsE